MGQLALSMQNHSRDSFPSDIKKNPKDPMKVTLRSCKELKKKEDKIEAGKESEQNNSEMTKERRKSMVQRSSQMRNENYKRNRR